MRIAYLCADPGIPVFGRKGASIHVQEVIRALLRQGATVELFTNRVGGDTPPGLETVTVHKMPDLPKGMDAGERELAALAANVEWVNTLAAAGPFTLVYERYSLWSDAGMTFAQQQGIPGLLEVNAPLIEEQSQHRTLCHRDAAEVVAQRTFGAASAILAVSDGVADYLKQVGSPADRVHVVPNGVDLARFVQCPLVGGKAVDPATKPFTVGFVGTLKAWHGLEGLVEAFALLHHWVPNARLLLVGDGPLRESLTADLAERGLLAATHFTGAVDHREIPAWLAGMDVAVAPYPPLENFYFSPLKVYEYMAAARPVVASAIGQINRVITHEQNGLLYPAGETKALASALLRLYKDPELAQRLGDAARQTIRQHHTWDAVAQRILALAGVNDGATRTPPSTPPNAPPADRPDRPATRPSKPQTLQQALPGLGEILRYFRPEILQQRMLIAVAVVSMVAGIGLRLLEPWPLKFIVDFLSNGDSRGLPLWLTSRLGAEGILAVAAVGAVAVVAAGAVTNYLSTVTMALAGNRILTQVRGRLYRHLLNLPLAYHTRAKGGDLLTRLIGDIGRLEEVAVTAMLPLLISCLTLVGMVSIMFWLNWQLALLGLATLPLAMLTMSRFSGRIRRTARDQRQREAELAATAAESLGAIRVVKAFSLEESLSAIFGAANQKNLKDGVRGKRLSASLERAIDIFIATGTALTLWYGAHLVLRGALTLGDLIVFLNYLKSAFRPMSDLAKYTGRIAKAVAAGERILDVLATEPAIQDRPDAIVAPRLQGAVTFDQVSFGYERAQPVLRNVSLHIPAGQKVALVGPSGAGKSTLASLLLRLYEPTAGTILVDGLPLDTYTTQSLRNQMSVVLQESLLFGDTVRANLRYGAPAADDEEIEAAARQVNAHDFIMALPEGYATVLGERGATLSGGQRQRLAIARAAVRRAPLVILDEPTVGLDEENAQAVQRALQGLTAYATTLIITHDLQLAVTADRILYLEDGAIREEGTHASLLALNGRYAALYKLQTRDKTAPEAATAPEAHHAYTA
ncbi:MAG: ATP-binding cassette domain-containing protein [Caldilineaceae bacterium]|nr:ATP-binding cassette domain-containing protein [Caldilineaceae bacterium]